jgi:mono/diheme cytochrome c family protein
MLVVAVGAAGYAISASAQANAPRDPQFIYERTCGYCHGHNVGPIIRGRNLPPAVIASIVRSGNGAMPAFRPTEISDQELAGLAAWISATPASAREHGE